MIKVVDTPFGVCYIIIASRKGVLFFRRLKLWQIQAELIFWLLAQSAKKETMQQQKTRKTIQNVLKKTNTANVATNTHFTKKQSKKKGVVYG